MRVPAGGIVFLNGRYVPALRARISALDRGFLYGHGLFETIRADDGKPCDARAHLKRLRKTARRIGLTLPGTDPEWERRMAELLRRNRLATGPAAVRLTVSRGAGGQGLIPPAGIRPTVLLTARRLDAKLERYRERGVRIVLLPFHPGLGGLLAGAKTVDYLTALVGKRIARRAGAFEGIYTSPSGEIFEGTTSNIFVLRGGSLVTPPLRAGVLPGVTRGQILRLARRSGLRVHERRLTRRDLFGAKEAFLTASTFGVIPVREVGTLRIGDPERAVTRQLATLLDRLRG